jgi:pimeloyl-ACP methyl ester carboxylesterase
VKRANASGRPPVVFIHGLWLLPSSWDRWAAVFKKAGYTTLTPGWPDDPETVEDANAHPEVFAEKSIKQVADHFADLIAQLSSKPAVIGHSFGGLITQIIAGRGLAATSVAADPAPFRGVLPLPISSLKSASPVLGKPANRNRAVPLTYEQFRFAFANAVTEDEAHKLYDTFAVPASGKPLFQAASANLNPWTEAKVDTKNPERGPLLIIDGEKDNTVPWAIANASFKRQRGRDRNRQNPQPQPFAHDRRRLAGGRRHRPELRAPLRQAMKHGPRPAYESDASEPLVVERSSNLRTGIRCPGAGQPERSVYPAAPCGRTERRRGHGAPGRHPVRGIAA